MLKRHYQNFLEENNFQPDVEQQKAVEELQRLANDIASVSKKSFFSFGRGEDVKGVYLYGGVGRGKSMLMDMFFNVLPNSIRKRRVHFHQFMIETHNWLHQARQDESEDTDDLLMGYAKYVSKQVKVLCFDEFHVVDVADAMILGRLFTALFERDVIVVATSNWSPDDLYTGGLQRQLFLPFIDLLKQKLKVVHLDSDTDYRQLSSIEGACGHYFHPLSEETKSKMDAEFQLLIGDAIPQKDNIGVKGRNITIFAVVDGVARFKFSELCEIPLGAEDYIAIAERYHTIFLEDVPLLGSDKRNEAKRFVLLIDCLYEANCILYMSSQSYIDSIYVGDDHAFEYNRTASRLKEMNSLVYCEKNELKK